MSRYQQDKQLLEQVCAKGTLCLFQTDKQTRKEVLACKEFIEQVLQQLFIAMQNNTVPTISEIAHQNTNASNSNLKPPSHSVVQSSLENVRAQLNAIKADIAR